MTINFDPQLLQTSLTNQFNQQLNNSNNKSNTFQAQIFSTVGTQINDLSKEIGESFVNIPQQLNIYFSKVDYLYGEYSKVKIQWEKFLDSNENINSISNNNNNNNLKLNRKYKCSLLLYLS